MLSMLNCKLAGVFTKDPTYKTCFPDRERTQTPQYPLTNKWEVTPNALANCVVVSPESPLENDPEIWIMFG